MKKTFFLLFSMLSLNLANAQGCLPEGILFSTQEQIDNFQTDYPGCSEIEGDVNIGISGTNINNLNGLGVLTAIGGNLTISSTNGLMSLNGLDQINSIGGSIIIIGNQSLQSLTGLQNISIIPANLYIRYCNALVSLDGLEGLQAVGNNFSVDDNDLLTDLSSLSNLDSVSGYLNIVNNEVLEGLAGLENLSYVGKGLTIDRNQTLNNLNGIEGLSLDSAKAVRVTNNPNLSVCNVEAICNYLSNPQGTVSIYRNAQGCSNPAEIAILCGIQQFCLPFGDNFFLSQADIDNFPSLYPGCDQLTGITIIVGEDIVNLNGLSQITSVSGTLDIGNSIFGNPPALQNLEGLNNVSSVGRHFVLQGLPYITDLSGIEGITSVGSGIGIYSNDLLTSLSSLSVEQVDGYVSISNNSSLKNLRGLEGLTEIPNDLYISGNESLDSLVGLNSLVNVGGICIISDCPNLTSLSGLDNVEHLGALSIEDNENLENISALGNLTSLNGYLRIDSNEKLSSLSGIDGIDAGSITDLSIAYNSLLSSCAVESICNYLLNPGGIIYVSGNSWGCNSQTEVEAACEEVGVENYPLNRNLRIYPNPANSAIFIETPKNSADQHLEIFNAGGQQMLNKTIAGISGVIDVSNLPKGFYFVKVFGSEGVQMGKFVRE
jgi:hypothetical protein